MGPTTPIQEKAPAPGGKCPVAGTRPGVGFSPQIPQKCAGTRIELSLSQDELARWTGATRETVSRALRLMRQLGWVATDHRTITVLDPAALRERAGDNAK